MELKEFKNEFREKNNEIMQLRKSGKDCTEKIEKLKNELLEKFKSMSIEDQLLYDFTNGYNENYDNLKEYDVIKKFLIYKNRENEKENYNGLIDPDSNSSLLQKIYRQLWDNEMPDYMKNKNNNGNICADTMTSALVPFEKYLQLKGVLSGAIHLVDCVKNAETLIEYFSNVKDKTVDKDVYNFIRLNHTIGNFIPVPDGFNTARAGAYAVDDNWFLTMEKIESFYERKKDFNLDSVSQILNFEIPILELLHINKKTVNATENTIKWLSQYNNFDEFEEENYLQDYSNDKIENFTWSKHKLTNTNYGDFFKKMNTVILQRSLRMIIALNSDKKIKLSEVEKVFENYGVTDENGAKIPEDLKKKLERDLEK